MKYVFLLFKDEFRVLFVNSVEDHNKDTFPVSQRKYLARFVECPLFWFYQSSN